jgi:hypothetical protein
VLIVTSDASAWAPPRLFADSVLSVSQAFALSAIFFSAASCDGGTRQVARVAKGSGL